MVRLQTLRLGIMCRKTRLCWFDQWLIVNGELLMIDCVCLVVSDELLVECSSRKVRRNTCCRISAAVCRGIGTVATWPTYKSEYLPRWNRL